MKGRFLLGVLLTCLVLGTGIAQGSKTKVTLMMYGLTDQEYFWNLIKEGFERDNPEYELEYTLAGNTTQYIEKLLIQYASGVMPDVFLTYAQYKSKFVEDGMLLDLTDRINRSSVMRLDRFFPVIKDNISYNGRMWGSPWGFNSKVWMVNMDLLDQAGLRFPGYNWTVDDLRNYSRKIAQPDKKIFGTANTSTGSGDGAALQWLYNWAGHTWIDASGRKVIFNSPGSVAMVDFWRELIIDSKVIPNTQYPRKTGATFLGTGDLAFYETWSTETQQIVNLQKQGIEPIRWRFTTYPKAPFAQQHVAWGHVWSIPANHPNPDKAWKLVEWLGSEACDYIWSASQRTPPLMANSRHWNAYNALLTESQKAEVQSFIVNTLYSQGYARNLEYWPTFDKMQAIVRAQYGNVYSGKVPAQTAVEQAAVQMQAILDEYWQSVK